MCISFCACRLCILNCPLCSRRPTRLVCARSTVESCSRPSTTRTWMTGYMPSILSLLAQFGKRQLLRSQGCEGRWSNQEADGWLQILILYWGIWQDVGTGGGSRVGKKTPQTIRKQTSPVFQKLQGLLFWLEMFWTAMSSLNMCGMLHLEATRCFPCISILQIYKVSYFLCAGLSF